MILCKTGDIKVVILGIFVKIKLVILGKIGYNTTADTGLFVTPAFKDILYYYAWPKENTNSNYEIDFMADGKTDCIPVYWIPFL